MGLLHWWRERRLARQLREEGGVADPTALTHDPRGGGRYAEQDAGTYEGPATAGHR